MKIVGDKIFVAFVGNFSVEIVVDFIVPLASTYNYGFRDSPVQLDKI